MRPHPFAFSHAQKYPRIARIKNTRREHENTAALQYYNIIVMNSRQTPLHVPREGRWQRAGP